MSLDSSDQYGQWADNPSDNDNDDGKETSATHPSATELSEAAFYGPLGEISKLIIPHTEADPAAILLQLIVGVGNAVGRNPHFKIEATKHHTNLFLILNGQSSKARKGTSWDNILNLLLKADFCYAPQIVSGLSSGEGLVSHLRDNRTRGDDDDEETPPIDKRLLVVESEFTRVLKVMGREGNTLSTIIRDAWDRGNFQVLTKRDPLKATNAHVSIIGHTTNEDLHRTLSACDVYNGFANRFLWAAAKRSRLLPHGGNLDPEKIAAHASSLSNLIGCAKAVGEMKRDDDAYAQWGEIYPKLSSEHPGKLGAVTNRAEGQVLRLSMIYALADGSSVIGLAHQNAALAVWAYCFNSACLIFKDLSDDDYATRNRAERILAVLKRCPKGLTRNQVLHDIFFGNLKADLLDQALKILERDKLARSIIESTGGRSAERWVSVTTT